MQHAGRSASGQVLPDRLPADSELPERSSDLRHAHARDQTRLQTSADDSAAVHLLLGAWSRRRRAAPHVNHRLH